jgi:N utilization substance protein B
MLNRRNLRIKAMQTLFAFQQVRASDQQIAVEQLEEAIGELPEKSVNAKELVDGLKMQLDYSTEAGPVADDLIASTLSDYQHQVEKDLKFLRAQMLKEVEGVHNLFLWVLGLFPALLEHESALLSKKRIMPKEPSKGIIAATRAIHLLEHALGSREIASWGQYQDRVSQWYKEIKGHQESDEWSQGQIDGLEQETKRLSYIFKSILWKSQSFQNFFEEHDRDWVENKDIIKSLVNKTLKSISEDGAVLAPLSYQWEDDKKFFEDVFDATIKHEAWSEQLIAESAKNWEVDRIAQVDRILLRMALSEMINFPSIPVKVTINEYIELSKKYSTPKSKKFINGILDVLANDLMAKGAIKKSGRGLIDNK